MSDDERTDYRARRMGFVFQFYNLMPVLSAVENVELPLLVARVPAQARRAARRSRRSRWSGSRERAAHVPDELSGGQRQRVTIARALVNDPAIVWADEPTGDLDSENAEEIVALMRRLNLERGLTFLIVTHDISVGRATDRIVRMVDGEIVDEELLEVTTDGRACHAGRDRRRAHEHRRRASSSTATSVMPAPRRAGRLRGLLRPALRRGQGARR